MCTTVLAVQGFPTFVGHIAPYRCAQNFDIVKLKFFTFLSCGIITHIASSLTFLTQFVKKTGHPLFGLSSKVFTFDQLFTHHSDNFFD